MKGKTSRIGKSRGKVRVAMLPRQQRRRGWASAFRRMAANHDDILLDGKARSGSTWDRADWEW